MNTFGEFLYQLRKEKGLTQAELAEHLGVTNKAVSKWETGEVMPEAKLLLPLAEILNVTVDELLNGKRLESRNHDKPRTDTPDVIKGHLFTRGKDDEPETVLDKICCIVCTVVVLSGIVFYLFIGAFAELWYPYWAIIPICALSSAIIGIIFNLCNADKRKKILKKGKNPYIEGVCGIIILACIIAYLFIGAFANLWHPYWFIIVCGAAVDGILGVIGAYKDFKNKN